MQTFMPYSSFESVAQCLDYKRLGKQRVEAWQIYQTLEKIKERQRLKEEIMILGKDNSISERLNELRTIAWENHPIVKMWKGYEITLLRYGLIMCNEWVARGYKDTLTQKFYNALNYNGHVSQSKPHWVFNLELQKSHQSNLLRKFPEHYQKYFKNIQDNLPYKWVL